MKSCLFVVLVFSVFGSLQLSAAKNVERPNVVWLGSEDNSAGWLKLYDENNGASMPNIEELAEQGAGLCRHRLNELEFDR